VRRPLVRSQAFVRAAKRLVKKSSYVAEDLRGALARLAEDAYQPGLRAHKLKSDLDGLWACRVGYDQRIVFSFVEQDGGEVILLRTVGNHDEV